MRNFWKFIKENYYIGYSLFLVLAIPAALFAFTFYTISLFERNFNHLIQSKASLAEEFLLI